MSYIKAEDILPEELIEKIQQYVDGKYIYIPRKAGSRNAWGHATTYRAELAQRNHSIRADHSRGLDVAALCEKYHLSEKSIRRILHN